MDQYVWFGNDFMLHELLDGIILIIQGWDKHQYYKYSSLCLPEGGFVAIGYLLKQGCPNYGPWLFSIHVIIGLPAQAINTAQHAIPLFN